MSAELIARALGGKKVGASWLAPCPAHADREPSLALRDGEDGRALVRCHAGCEQGAVIAALRARGLWGANVSASPSWQQRPRSDGAGPDSDAKRKSALAIWQAAKPAQGSLVETYLRSRGISLPPPPSLRFHAGLKHPSGGSWPCMVALVVSGVDGLPAAIHRTYLALDGSSKAPISPQRMMLGPVRGGAVRRGGSGAPLLVGEGLETCLAGTQLSGHRAWAALSTSGMRTLDLPEDIRDVIVLADGDDAGEAAALDCGLRWKREGRRVRIARPPRGCDFNDMLVGRAPRTRRDAPASLALRRGGSQRVEEGARS
jgi:putative DNA primase/helicase